MKIKTVAVAVFYDSYTKQQIPDGLLRLQLQKQGIQMVRKSDSYCCFLEDNPQEMELALLAEAEGYQAKTISLARSYGKWVEVVWLHPSKQYQMPIETALYLTEVKTDFIEVALLQKRQALRMKDFMEKGSEKILLANLSLGEKTGKKYLFLEEKQMEYLQEMNDMTLATLELETVFVREEEDNFLCLEEALRKDHGKDELLFPIEMVQRQKDGTCYLPFREVTKDSVALVIQEGMPRLYKVGV